MAQSTAAAPDLYYDPYSVELNMDPYAVFARIRDRCITTNNTTSTP
ncbi:MAG: hypothetical protein K0R33_2315 [Mycobacterium sp.]|nr:hypothetical protein [Mycobacterium sp.]